MKGSWGPSHTQSDLKGLQTGMSADDRNVQGLKGVTRARPTFFF